MAEKTTNATRLIDSITARAVLLVGKANEGKRLTEAQWTAAVQDAVEALLTKVLDDMVQEDPATAERITRQLAAGLEQDGAN